MPQALSSHSQIFCFLFLGVYHRPYHSNFFERHLASHCTVALHRLSVSVSVRLRDSESDVSSFAQRLSRKHNGELRAFDMNYEVTSEPESEDSEQFFCVPYITAAVLFLLFVYN